MQTRISTLLAFVLCTSCSAPTEILEGAPGLRILGLASPTSDADCRFHPAIDDASILTLDVQQERAFSLPFVVEYIPDPDEPTESLASIRAQSTWQFPLPPLGESGITTTDSFEDRRVFQDRGTSYQVPEGLSVARFQLASERSLTQLETIREHSPINVGLVFETVAETGALLSASFALSVGLCVACDDAQQTYRTHACTPDL